MFGKRYERLTSDFGVNASHKSAEGTSRNIFSMRTDMICTTHLQCKFYYTINRNSVSFRRKVTSPVKKLTYK